MYENILKLRFEQLIGDDEEEGTEPNPPRELTSEEWNQLFDESQHRLSCESRRKLNRIMLRTKILYSQPLDDQLSVAGSPHDDGGGLLGRPGDGHNFQQNRDHGAIESLFSDLRVDCKDIEIGLKDLEQLHRVCKEIYRRSK